MVQNFDVSLSRNFMHVLRKFLYYSQIIISPARVPRPVTPFYTCPPGGDKSQDLVHRLKPGHTWFIDTKLRDFYILKQRPAFQYWLIGRSTAGESEFFSINPFFNQLYFFCFLKKCKIFKGNIIFLKELFGFGN